MNNKTKIIQDSEFDYTSWQSIGINKAICRGVTYSWMQPNIKGGMCGWVGDNNTLIQYK